MSDDAEDIEDDDDALDDLVEKLAPIQTAIGEIIDDLSPVHDAMARFERGGKARAAEIERIRDRLIALEGALADAMPTEFEVLNCSLFNSAAARAWAHRAFMAAMDALIRQALKRQKGYGEGDA